MLQAQLNEGRENKAAKDAHILRNGIQEKNAKKKHRKQRKWETKHLSETAFEKNVRKRKTINISNGAGVQY